ncbi:hypothetical protein MINTM020_39880 [Mycobacterium paraintracellulare]|nr:hypothetical protein MINTM020_39880 [Mycobacterium paraintracellulare]
MSVPNPWTRHYQIAWEERANDRNLPLWLRVACLAYARHEANGHANFRRGQLSWILGTPPQDDKPFKRIDSSTVGDAIKRAAKYGWLSNESCAECLVVPGHAIEGPQGNPHKPCAVHERKIALKRSRATRLRVVS